MSVIIRLQNLPWSANAGDIRTYFQGLSIPEGGVHIVGGEQGDAFIAFSTDEDARQAMLMDGGKLKEVKIKLLLSSRTEMLRVIEQARQQALKLQDLMINPVVQPMVPVLPTNVLPDAAKNEFGKDDPGRQRPISREDSRGRSSENDRSRDRSRERNRERRERDRRVGGGGGRRERSRDRSRDRHRNRRSRSRDRKRASRENDGKERPRHRDMREDQGKPDEKRTGWDKPGPTSPPMNQGKVLLPDPPAVPQLLIQFQQNGKDGPHQQNFPDDRKPFGYGNPMNQMPMRPGRENWPMGGGMPMMNPNMVMPRAPLLPNPDMPNYPQNFPMQQPMFPMHDMWQMPGHQGMDNSQGPDLCIEIRGLPANVSYIDIKKLFDGLSIPSDGIKMINDNHGGRTGIAYVKFTCKAHKQSALNQNGKKVRSNVVEVLHLRDDIYAKAIDNFKPDKDGSKNDDMDIENDMGDDWNDDSEGGNRGRDRKGPRDNYNQDMKTTLLKIKGIPHNSSERDIFDFFSELGVTPANVNFLFDNMGAPLGEVVCAFETEEEAETAAKKDNSYMGRFQVSVERMPKEDFGPPMNNWNGPPNYRMRGGRHPMDRGDRYRGDDRFDRRDRNRGERNYEDKREWRERGPPMRVDFQRGERGGMRGRGSMHMMNGPMRPNRQNRSDSPYIDGDSVDSFGRPGCVVALENLHFRADIDDILQFFEDFGIENEDVIRRFDDKGRATGDARVSLKSPSEAARAVRQLNQQSMRGRPIKVSII